MYIFKNFTRGFLTQLRYQVFPHNTVTLKKDLIDS